MDILLHKTIETGHVRQSLRREVDPDILAALRPLVSEAVKHSKRPVHVGAGWWIRAELDGGRLAFDLAGDRSGPWVYSCTVTRADGPARPALLEVSIAGMSEWVRGKRGPAEIERAVELSMQAGDLERCIAWAWLVGGE